LRADEKKNGEFAVQARSTGARDYLELWINLARREWGSLVVIPADRDGSTADIANALADIGQRLSYGPVTAITVTSLEYGSALALADLQQHVERERRSWSRPAPVVNVPPEGAAPGAPAAGADPSAPAGTDSSGTSPQGASREDADRPQAAADGGGASQALAVAPPARLIISVPPVVTEPLGLAAAEEADSVVLAIRMNHSRMADVRRTIALVGRDRITGCFLVR